MLASDDQNPQFAGAKNPDDVLLVTFYVRPIKDNFKSEKEGRPVFFDQVWVKILTPGNALNIIDAPAIKQDEIRFPRQWAQFKNSTSPVQISGTPVDQWPAVTRSQAEELKGAKFYTVEQIAGCSDLQVQSMGMGGYTLRERAKAFLASASQTANAQADAAEKARLQEQLDAQKKELAALRALVQGGEKPKRKYTKRVKPEASPPSG